MTGEERRPSSGGAAWAAGSGRPALILALILGLAGVVFICFFVHFYETVIFECGEQYDTVFHALTPIVFIMVFLVLLVFNPLLSLLARGVTQLGRWPRLVTWLLVVIGLGGGIWFAFRLVTAVVLLIDLGARGFAIHAFTLPGLLALIAFLGPIVTLLAWLGLARREYLGRALPLLGSRIRDLFFRRREFTVIFAMWLLTGAICYVGLAQPVLTMAGTFMSPTLTRPVVDRTGFKNYLPSQLFLPKSAATEFRYGLSTTVHRIALDRVPWDAWRGPLTYWLPFMLVIVVFTSSLVQMMHRQWSSHELLAYPIGNVADLLIGQRPGRAWPNLFYSRVFWIGFGISGGIALVNGLGTWIPQVPKFNLAYGGVSLARDFPFLNKYCATFIGSLFTWRLVPYIIGLAVLLPTELSLTCWLAWVLTLLGTGFYFLLSGEVIAEQATNSLHYGMFTALALVVILVGRREYARIVKHAFSFQRHADPVINQAAMACRVFLLAFAALTGLLTYAGLYWLIALVVTAIFGIFVIVLARITAEVGFPFLWDYFSTVQFMTLQMLGAAAIGPKGLVILGCIGGMLDFSPGNTLAQNETTYRKLAEKEPARRLSRGWFNVLLLATACVAIGATTFFFVWDDMSFGAQKERVTSVYIDKHIMTKMGPELETLQNTGRAEELDKARGFAKLKLIQAKAGFWKFFAYGALLVGSCALLRLRFAWWPFHPLPLLFFNVWAMSRLMPSFLIGWFIKVALTRIGGGRTYMRSKPFFVGLILGQLTVGGVWLTVNALYFLLTGGAMPKSTIWYLG